MISSSRQLKDKVRNISDGNSNKASMPSRNFMMERFLERVSISSYRDNFILKGGMLVASIVGVDMRVTMDMDTTVKALPLNEADVQNFYEEQIEKRVLYDAFSATCEKRKTIFTKDDIEATLHLISDDLHMEELWEQFKKSNFYVGELEWKSVIDYVEKIMKKNLL